MIWPGAWPHAVPSHSLPKTSLLTKPWEYRKVYAHGKRLRGHRFSLIYLPNELGENRLGISVHGEKSAVKRNRIKRIVREFYRCNRSLLSQGLTGDARPGSSVDVVVAIRKGFRPDHPQAVKEAVQRLLEHPPSS